MKDSSPIVEKRTAVAATVKATKQIAELPRDQNWKYNPKHVQACIGHIMTVCETYGIIPTVNYMSMALGISKMTEYNVRSGVTAADAQVVELLNEYARICENVLIQSSLDGTANNITGIFALKSLYGYRDEPQQIVVTHQFNGLLGERRDPEAIAARYAEAVVLDVEPGEIRELEKLEAHNGDDDNEG